jgi:hypothetical protein
MEVVVAFLGANTALAWRNWGKLRKPSVRAADLRVENLKTGSPEYEGVLTTRS